MKKFPILSALAVTLMLSSCGYSKVYPLFPSEDTAPQYVLFEEGYRYEKGLGVPRDYARAISLYQQAEKAGDIRAINSLGLMKLQGKGSAVNHSGAYSDFQRAANFGSSNGHYNLGLMSDLGIGRAVDHRKAALSYRMAAHQGHPQAQFRLAEMLDAGLSTPATVDEARRFHEMAAVSGDKLSLERLATLRGGRPVTAEEAAGFFAEDHCSCDTKSEKAMASRGVQKMQELANDGDPTAQYNLGVRLLNGRSSNHDEAEAARMFTLAAKQGYGPAQRQLGQMYLRGDAVGKSKVLAHAWLNLASKNVGDDAYAAREEMEALERSMSVHDVREAQEIAESGALKGR